MTDNWQPFCEFFVHGEPKAQPRPRAFARKMGDKFVARVYDAGTAEGWKGCVAMAARPHLPTSPLAGAVRLDVVFFFPRPKYMLTRKFSDEPIRHTGKPDRDNLEKSVSDCLKQLGMFVDDGQICDGVIRKMYTAKGAASGASVRISVEPALFQPAESA